MQFFLILGFMEAFWERKLVEIMMFEGGSGILKGRIDEDEYC